MRSTSSESASNRLKTVAQSRCMMTEIVLPNDTNGLGNLMGGRLLNWMDICTAISAQRHAQLVCVTAAVDSVEFRSPIYQNEVVILESQVNRAFRTSMEIGITVWAENPREQTKRLCNKAYFTFVAIGVDGVPVPVPPVVPETDEERDQYERAAKRRELRLILRGRLALEDAKHIKNDLLAAVRPEV